MKTHKQKLEKLKELAQRRREEQEEHLYRSFAGTLTTDELHAIVNAKEGAPILNEIMQRFEAYRSTYERTVIRGL